MKEVRRGAIVGFGNVAANGHLPGWQTREDFEIVAIADPDAQRRALAGECLPQARLYAGHEELLAHEALDFIDIASPPALHAAAILAAAEAGVHVLCEKPLTTSLEEYEDIRLAVQRAGVVLHTVHNWKYSEAFRRARAMVASGRLGALSAISFDTARNGCAAATRDNWRVRAALAGGGILVDHGWHAFYLMLAFANERPLRIRATLERRRYREAEVEDTARCAVDFPSLKAEIRLTWAAQERRTRWKLIGSKGQLLINEDQLIVEAEGAPQTQRLESALSASSHHPDWFAGVIDEFRTALNDPAQAHANRLEAELCMLMLSQAYASSAQQSRPLAIPRARVAAFSTPERCGATEPQRVS